MKIAVRIMHHLSRPVPAELIRALAPLHALYTDMVFRDAESRGAWWNARQCWDAYEPDATHVLVVHDDAIPIPGIANVLRDAVAAQPDQILSFYSSQPQFTEHVADARNNGCSWVATVTGCCGLATIMPVAIASEFVAWCDTNIREDWKADDTRIALFAAASMRRIWISLPNVFQHPPDGRGVDGGTNKSSVNFATKSLPIHFTPATYKPLGFDEAAREMKLYLRERRSKFKEGTKHAQG